MITQKTPDSKGTSDSLELIAAIIRKLDTVLVVSHTSPDADAYGSSCALALALKGLGKNVLCVNESGRLKKYSFIPGIADIVSKTGEIKPDCVVILDCGDLKRVGDSLIETVLACPITVNIDHHVSNNAFGKYNYVLPSASSTCEIVYSLIESLKVNLDQPIATCLLTGIMGDTGSFRYSSTSAHTMEIASKLLRAGARPEYIANSLFGSLSKNAFKLRMDALSKIEFFVDDSVAFVCVSESDYLKNRVSKEDTEGLVEMARDIEGVRVAVLLYQDGEIWKASLRSRCEDDNVSDIASLFGGGGHRMASGLRWRGDINALKSKLLDSLQTLLGRAV
jgi:phosphoesterase RecJ-like protein